MASERKARGTTKSKGRGSGSRKTGGGSSGGASPSRSASQSKRSDSRSQRSASQSKGSDSRSQRSTSQSKGSDSRSHAEQSRGPASENGNASRRGLNAAEAVEHAREQLSQLLGRPVESVLGVDRAEGGWVVAAEVLELARVPNTTDVLGEYRATLDRDGELLGFEQRRRYSRGHTTGGES